MKSWLSAKFMGWVEKSYVPFALWLSKIPVPFDFRGWLEDSGLCVGVRCVDSPVPAFRYNAAKRGGAIPPRDLGVELRLPGIWNV